MKVSTSFFTLITSTGTLICCALPALLVTLGFGATVASMASSFPQLVWLSQHKEWVFALTLGLLVFGGVSLARGRNLPCPTDPHLRKQCLKTRRVSTYLYSISLLLCVVGISFAYILPLVL